MYSRAAAVLALVLYLALLAAPAIAQTDFGGDPARYLKLDWRAQPEGAFTAVWGHVFNDYGLPARDIVLLVESLDAAGRPVAQANAWIPYVVAPGTTAYFEARLPAAAAYRVSVASFHWVFGDREDFGIRRRR
jgi:hypothetical protein